MEIERHHQEALQGLLDFCRGQHPRTLLFGCLSAAQAEQALEAALKCFGSPPIEANHVEYLKESA